MKKPRNNINGWLIVNKPVGIGSTRVVSIVKRVFNAKKVGHAGTLDPLAEGVLPIALGEATKTINYMMDAEKEYIFTIKFGAATSTDDMEGEVVATSDKIPTQQEIETILPEFIGEIEQTPPAYSAIKVDGKRAYDLARSGQEVKLKSRKVNIYQLEVVDEKSRSDTNKTMCEATLTPSPLRGEGWDGGVPLGINEPVKSPPPCPSPLKGERTLDDSSQTTTTDTATLRVKCSKGTYVRSLARDIAEKLGSKGHVTRLIRTKVGKFHINDAILLEKIEKIVYKTASEILEDDILLPVMEVLDDIPVLSLTDSEARAITQGKKIELVNCDLKDGDIAAAKSQEKLIALVTLLDGRLKPVRVFNL